jgi:outer membrane immunogenic protein
MRKTRELAVAAAIAALTGTPLLAADLPVTARPLAPVYAFSWTGCYLGVNAGYAWGSSNVTFTERGAFLSRPPADVAFSDQLGSPNIPLNGFTGGGQAGCNYQTGSVVIGVEGDGDYVGLNGAKYAAGTIPIGGTSVIANESVSSHSLFTARVRAGYQVGRTLFYATGGYAGGNVSYSGFITHDPGVTFMSGTVSSLDNGWTVGGGVEYAIANNWTVKGEYLYVDLGSVSFSAADNRNPAFNSTNSANLKENIVRFGLNYKFGSGPTVYFSDDD